MIGSSVTQALALTASGQTIHFRRAQIRAEDSGPDKRVKRPMGPQSRKTDKGHWEVPNLSVIMASMMFATTTGYELSIRTIPKEEG